MSTYFDVAKGQPQTFRAIRRSDSTYLHSSTSYDSADLLCLEDFSDAELLHGLWARYERQQIYTWLGDVLVSVNPYSNVGAFDEEVAARYAGVKTPKAPHLYAVVGQALAAKGERHALLITGESGAGKTEATRAVLSFLAKRHPATTDVRDKLLRSTPVLEAFGNAHTRQNANSSRFGKFIEVHLAASGEVVGATLQPYMLEASRVSGDLPQGERTYHIFYLLKAALNAVSKEVRTAPQTPFWDRIIREKGWNELAQLASGLMDASPRLQDGPAEASCLEGFEVLVEGLLATGMKVSQVAECCRVVAAVALLSDPELGDQSLPVSAKLLRLEEAELRSFLWRIMMSVGGERVYRERNKAEATTLRASLAQELYASLFTWLTRFIAQGIAPRQDGGRMLGLLDLYGFEVFPTNGFEQFLINYCNERLQQFFNRQVFAREAEEYAAEGLDWDGHWSNCAAACQLPALALLEGRGGVGIFHVIDDRSKCNFEEAQNGSNTVGALAETLSISCSSHQAFCRASGRDSSRLFGVKHFAGQVFYEASDFVRKNASAHRPDISAFLRAHGGTFVREMISDDKDAALPRRGRKLFGRTLINIFQQELNELCSTLEARDCWHIRCLRPNDEQKPLVFDDASMLRQCRYSGLLEATRIRRQGFAHRRTLRNFSLRYAMLLAAQEDRKEARQPAKDASISCKAISEVATQSGVLAEDVRIGHSKVFMRESALAWFEGQRSSIALLRVTAALRGNVARRSFLRLRGVARRLQAWVRGCATRRLVAALRRHREAEHAAQLAAQREVAARARALIREDAALQLQGFWRSRRAQREQATRVEVVTLQSCRNHGWSDNVEDKPKVPQAQPVEVPSCRLTRHIGEVRVCVPTCRQWNSRPLGYHEIVAGTTPRVRKEQESIIFGRPYPTAAGPVQVQAYPATSGSAPSVPRPRPASQSKVLREVHTTKTRSTSSFFSPRTELRAFATPTTQTRLCRLGVASVAPPSVSSVPSAPSMPSAPSAPSGISTVGAPTQTASAGSLGWHRTGATSPWRPHSFTPPGVVVPAWAWLPEEAKRPSETSKLLNLPTPNRSRSLQRVVGTLHGPPLRATLSGMPTALRAARDARQVQGRLRCPEATGNNGQ